MSSPTSSSTTSPMTSGSAPNGQPQSPIEEYPIVDLSDFLSRHQRFPVGRGYYSDVYKFKALDSHRTIKVDQFYAVKHFRSHLSRNSDKLKKRLIREINTWTPLEHANLLKLHGGIFTRELGNSELPSLVSDWMPYGHAAGYFVTAQPSELVPFLLGIGSGLSYLHSQSIAHGDLKTDNILVTASGKACVSDFGLSRFLQADVDAALLESSSDGNHVCRWTAIEYMWQTGGPTTPTKKGDVWSFGCVAMHLFSGKEPFHEVHMAPQIVMCLREGSLPEFPREIERMEFEQYRPGIFAVTRLCWIKEPVFRPNIDVVKSFIESYFPREQGFQPPDVVPIARTSSPVPAPSSDTGELEESFRRTDIGGPSRSSTMDTVTGNYGITSSTSSFSRTDGESRSRASSSVSAASFVSEGSDGSGTSTEPEQRPNEAHQQPWRSIPRPPSPSVETMLRHIQKSSVSKLLEIFQGRGPIPDFEEDTVGPAHVPIHTCVVRVNGVEQGKAGGMGRKRDIKQRAALVALENLREQEPDSPRFSDLKYWPVFLAHMRRHGQEVQTSISDEPDFNDQGLAVYHVQINHNNVLLSNGSGQTRDEAREAAVRHAFDTWN